MLLLADRNFPGYELWGLAAGTGADLLWRIKKNTVFVPVRVLPDGSFISVMPTPAETRVHGQARAAGRPLDRIPEGHTVRIIEYTVTIRAADGSTRIEPFRLVTTLLDHHRAPARELAALYAQRWEIENGYGELKTRLRGTGFILRSKSPELVTQEVYAMLTVYQALSTFKTETAASVGIDPDRISFTRVPQLVGTRWAEIAWGTVDVAACGVGGRVPTPSGLSLRAVSAGQRGCRPVIRGGGVMSQAR